MGKQDWWSSRSAVDDGARGDSLDDAIWNSRDDDDDDDDTGSWLDDFSFSDYAEQSTGSAVSTIWGRYGRYVDQSDNAAKLAAALRLVQGFVDTFATGDKPYRVSFDESVGTAGTDFVGRTIAISHKPLFDPTLTQDEAHTVMTAMAAHEASHVRYGRSTARAVATAFPGDALADRLSNILDDYRIERRYARDFPGYEGIFAPALAYVAKSSLGENVPNGSTFRGGNLAVAGTRYPQFIDWTGVEGERDWWSAWATTFSANDTPKLHVEGVGAALDHLKDIAKQDRKERERKQAAKQGDPTGEGEGVPSKKSGASQSDGQSASQSESQSESQDESQSDGQSESQSESQSASQSESQDEITDEGPTLAQCWSDGVGNAAHGQTDRLGSGQAQDLANQGEHLTSPDANGQRGLVYWGPRGLHLSRRGLDSPIGAAAIKAAFLRARTGHFARERYQRAGRVDNCSLTRVVGSDQRIFAKRHAPSEQRYRVWLLVDCSGSMSGRPIDEAASVAQALVASTRSVPTVSLDVWGWTSGGNGTSGGVGAFQAVRVWTEGRDLADIGFLKSFGGGSTPDKETVQWAAKAIVAQSRSDEKPLIIIASDGQGSLRGDDGKATIAAIRKSGVAVVSVAIGRVRDDHFTNIYGQHGFVPFRGSISAMARPLAQVIARFASQG